MGSETNERVRAVGDRRSSSFLFSPSENNYISSTAGASPLAAVLRTYWVCSCAWRIDPKRLLICSCEDTMRLDTAAVKRGCRNSEISEFRQLCRAELDHVSQCSKG